MGPWGRKSIRYSRQLVRDFFMLTVIPLYFFNMLAKRPV